MLDIKFIRENKDVVQGGANKKGIKINIEKLLELDDTRLKELKEIEDLRSEINRVSDQISRDQQGAQKMQLIEEMRAVKEDIKAKEEKFRSVMEQWQKLMLEVPNVPDMSVPDGTSEDDNKELRTWGEKPAFSFDAKDHMQIMTALEMADFDRGTKTHGFRGYFLQNDGALLSWAIWNYAQEFFLKKNFSPFIPPVIVNKEHLYGTGHLPGGGEDIFQTQDGQYLAGTAEIPMMAYHAGEILKEDELPKRYLAFSPCFRREAGAHSKDVKGLIRVHEFYKLEQLILCRADHNDSVEFHEELNRNTEEFIESLGIPYRQVAICTGDLKGAHVKSYDTELWVPKEEKYREIASASYYHDFQTRRFNIKYRDAQGKTHYTHSLNATAIPTPRILVSLIENFQQADGSVLIPEVLRKYMGGREFIK